MLARRTHCLGLFASVAFLVIGLACSGQVGNTSDMGGGQSDGPPGMPGVPIVGGGPPAGNPEGQCAIPSEGGAEDTSSPTRVIGNGTAASCSGQAVVDAVAQGGIITFDCGPDPVTITLDR